MLLALCPSAFALNPALDVSQYAHTAWKIREGFTEGTINSIAQTPDGYLWLGTELGLLRFDGVRNVPWQPPSDQLLPSNEIRSLLVARDGTLWIGTARGLASWKGGKLTHYEALAESFVGGLLEDREGSIWTARFASTWTLCAIQKGRVQCYGEDGGPGAGAIGLYEDSTGNLWVGTLTGFWRWRPGPPEFFPLPGETSGIHGLLEGDDGALLIAKGGGIRRLVGGKAEMAYPFPVSVQQFTVNKLLRDRDGGLWIGGSGGGLVHMHQGITDVFAQPDGLSDDAVYALFEDREGNIWVATRDGLDRFRDVAVATMSVKQGLSNDNVSSVLAAKDGSVWLGTLDGLNRWSNDHLTVYRERTTRAAQESRPRVSRKVREITGRGMPDGAVQSIFQDSRGRVWVSTLRGVAYLEKDRFLPLDGLPGGLTRAIVEDSRGSLWIANRDRGLFRVSPGGDVEQASWASLNLKKNITAVAADPSRGGLWFGFLESGLTQFSDGRIVASYAAADGLGEGRVSALQLDHEGTLWAATSRGLSRLKNSRVATLTMNNGLPCDAVGWVIEDDARSLWLGMTCGLVRIARAEIDAWAAQVDKDRGAKPPVRTTVFDNTDGVRIHPPSTSYYTAPAAKSSDGKLWFTSLAGLSVVDPLHLPFNRLPPPVHIERVTADRKTFDTTPGASGQVRLPALSRDLQVDYTAVSLVAPEKNRFKVKLEGWDRDWHDVGNRRQAYYTNLPPRNYRFRVIASNNSGVWNEAGAALDFAIAPAYYQTAWFRTLAVVMFLSLLWSAYRIRLRVIERHEAEISALNESLMKAQEQERTRIAGELHDGVMQQISALSLVLGTGRRQPEAAAKQTMADVQRKLIEVGTEVRQLSHNLHPPMLKDAGLPEALRGYCEEFSRVRNLPVSCHANDSVQDLSRGAALALYRIAQEAMGNAVTHGAAQHVNVRLTRTNGFVVLTVTDDGTGFDANRIGGVRGLGLINMRERARQLHGTFELTSEPGRGTTVRVAIPFRRTV
jgi:signal transduction histidine kinase/ligand-binding sensor domain-containing protein